METKGKTDWLGEAIGEFASDDPDLRELVSMARTRRERLREMGRIRHQRDLPQTDLARKMHTSQAAVARLESGAADPKLSTLERYAAALGMRLDWRLSQGPGSVPDGSVVVTLLLRGPVQADGRPLSRTLEMRTDVDDGMAIIDSLLKAWRLAAGSAGRGTSDKSDHPIPTSVPATVSSNARALYDEIFKELTVDEARAIWGVGKALADQGDWPGAERAFQRVAESGRHEVVPTAWNGLGVARYKQDDPSGAQTYFGLAIASGDTSVVPKATRNLAMTLTLLGEVDQARALFMRVTEMDEPLQAAWAWFNLGDLEADRDVGAAQSAYDRAAQSGIKEVIDAVRVAVDRIKSHMDASELIQGTATQQETMSWPAEPDPEVAAEIAITEALPEHDHVRAVVDALSRSAVYGLGEPAGEVSNGSGTESDILHFTVRGPDGTEMTVLPIFTRMELMKGALLRNSDWRKLSVLEFDGADLLANIDPDVAVVLNPWTTLEFRVPPRVDETRQDSSEQS